MGQITEQARRTQDVEAIPTLAWSARPDGSAEFLNRHWLDYTGLSAEEASDWGWTAALHTKDRDRLTDFWRHLLDSGEAGEIEARLRRHDGDYRWFLFRVEPARSPTAERPCSKRSGSVLRRAAPHVRDKDGAQAIRIIRSSLC
jgi:PAS domain S-box-containing protein